MLKLNKKKLKDKGLNFKNKSELLDFVKHKLEWLASHNKNYTTEQYHLIDMLKEIFDCFEEEDTPAQTKKQAELTKILPKN